MSPFRILAPAAALLAALVTGCGNSGASNLHQDPHLPQEAPSLASLVDSARVQGKQPAMSAAYAEGEREGAAASGLRKLDETAPVTAADRFNTGSIGKSMLSLTAALLVAEGRIQFETSVGQALGGVLPVHPAWNRVSLEHLLAHRGGLPRDNDPAAIPYAMEFLQNLWDRRDGAPAWQRLELARTLLSQPPEAEADTRFAYSNLGYVLAGLMVEQAAGMPFETLLEERLLRPMGISQLNFGHPAAQDPRQPWGHVGGRPIAPRVPAEFGPGPWPSGLSPSGDVSLSAADALRYGKAVLRIAAGQDARFPAAVVNRVFRAHSLYGAGSPEEQAAQAQGYEQAGYALGWETLRRKGSGEMLYFHTGEVDGFHAALYLDTGKRRVLYAACNSLDESSMPAVGGLLGEIQTLLDKGVFPRS